MNPVNRQDTDLLRRAVRTVQDARSLDDVVHGLVAELRNRFELWHLGVVTVPAGASRFRVIASWSMADSAFVPGTEVEASISPGMLELLDRLLADEIVVAEMDSSGQWLVDHLMREQGVASVVAVPVHHDENGLLFLGLGSSAMGPFQEISEGFFHGLAAGIRGRLVELTASGTNL